MPTVPVRPAGGVPVPPVSDSADAVCGPDDHVRYAGAQLLLAPRASVGAARARATDPPHDPGRPGIPLLARDRRGKASEVERSGVVAAPVGPGHKAILSRLGR